MGWASARHLLATAIVALALAPAADALTRGGDVGPVKYTVYAPDWTWQDREVNILVVLRNEGSAPVEATLGLDFPPGKREDFAYKAPGETALTLPPGETARHAFVGIKPLGRAPRQVYPFGIRIRAAANEARVEYPLRTIRGAAVRPGKWAVLLPAAMALAWCAVMLAALRIMADRGAWLRPSKPATEPEVPEEWITRTPQ